MNPYLQETWQLNYNSESIQALIASKGWGEMMTMEAIQSIYNFVRDDIRFGYNVDDRIQASDVLADGYGQCNTKAVLIMALLRGIGVACRLHGTTIDKTLQKGAITGIWYMLSPQELFHTWVEVFYEEQWYALEGIILDRQYLDRLQERFCNVTGSFCGYGVATTDFVNPPIDWNENDTFIQKEGVVQDFGIFDSPDVFFEQYQQQLNPLKKWVYRNIVRHVFNRGVARIRN